MATNEDKKKREAAIIRAARVKGSDLFNNIHNPKRERLKDGTRWCGQCGMKHASIADCSKMSPEKIVRFADRMSAGEIWAKGRISYYIDELTLAHGKMAMQRHEIHKLRAKLKVINDEIETIHPHATSCKRDSEDQAIPKSNTTGIR